MGGPWGSVGVLAWRGRRQGPPHGHRALPGDCWDPQRRPEPEVSGSLEAAAAADWGPGCLHPPGTVAALGGADSQLRRRLRGPEPRGGRGVAAGRGPEVRAARSPGGVTTQAQLRGGSGGTTSQPRPPPTQRPVWCGNFAQRLSEAQRLSGESRRPAPESVGAWATRGANAGQRLSPGVGMTSERVRAPLPPAVPPQGRLQQACLCAGPGLLSSSPEAQPTSWGAAGCGPESPRLAGEGEGAPWVSGRPGSGHPAGQSWCASAFWVGRGRREPGVLGAVTRVQAQHPFLHSRALATRSGALCLLLARPAPHGRPSGLSAICPAARPS